MKQKIFLKLKTKAAQLGFNREELQGIAATIADNLGSEEATDEDIDAQIDAVLPILKVGQQQAQRIAKAAKPTPTKTGDGDDDDEDENNPTVTEKKPKKKTEEKSDEIPAWVKAMQKTMEALAGEVSTLKSEKTTTTHKSKLEEILKDSGDFGKRELKKFSRMKFDSEEEFDDYLSEVEEDLASYKQEQADEGLSSIANPVGGSGKGDGNKKDLSDKEIDEIVGGIH